MFKSSTVALIGLMIALLGGVAIGVTIPFDTVRNRVSALITGDENSVSGDASSGNQHPHSPDHIELTETAQQSLGLRTIRLGRSDLLSTFEVPAILRELPGAQDLHISSRFEGQVKRVFVSEGQTVRPGDAICEIDLAGEMLATAQSELLDALKQVEIVELELERLRPLVGSGGVAAKRLREIEYEKNRLVAKIETKTQELLVRGLTSEQVQVIVDSKNLVRSITVRVTGDAMPPQLNAGDLISGQPNEFVVESLFKPGSMAEKGATLCRLSYHGFLAVEGHAYEKDLARVRDAIAEQTPISISIGSRGKEQVVGGLQLAFVSNHVDDTSGTYPFYAYVKNEKTSGLSADSHYVAWRWKPGQRAHIEVPDLKLADKIVLPREAVAQDGVSNYVFRWNGVVPHDHEHVEGETEADHAELDDFQAIEVVITHKSRKHFVIELAGDLKLGDRIVANTAAQLLFAMKAGTGGGHGHDHEH